MRISELKERRIIRRATRNFDSEGKRIYNEFEYDFPYNPTHKGNETERLFAKIIDLIPFFLIIRFGFHELMIVSLFFSIVCVLIFGSLSETLWGTTLGKKIFRLKVLNDNGNYPNILKSLQRNLLSFANFTPVFTDFVPGPNDHFNDPSTNISLSMHLNNKICKTFIVKESKIPEIKKLLSEKKLA
ncbi:RDD family protein [Chryseobacterium sp. RLHN22]|uniref:RDD family protein n=1 Tax=Chryseobacterium sp. RLHN22 TaxID=3437885 RepID=UPI003D9BEB76